MRDTGKKGLRALDRLTEGTNSTLFVWFVISVTVNLLLFAEQSGVVSFHPENLTGLYSHAEAAVEGLLKWGSIAVTLIVGVRALLRKVYSSKGES